MARAIRTTLAALAAMAMSLLTPQPSWADSNKQPAITAVRADAALVSIEISGVNLGTKPPRVTIGNVANALTITSATQTLVTALLPPGLAPGGYLLTYSAAKNKSGSDDDEGGNYDEFWVTLGAAGPQGLQGPKGDAGSPGPVGLTGPAGAKGDAGPQGPAGKDGLTGPAGSQGVAGVAGSQGSQGPMGLQGPQGLQGISGARGNSIELVGPADKDVCPEGGHVYQIVSDKGAIAGTETSICNGLPGLDGANGTAGPAGAAGAKGDAGPQGAQGLQGPAGPSGPQGVAGTAGATGPAGPQGPAGPAGTSMPPILIMQKVNGPVFNITDPFQKVLANCPAGTVVIGGGYYQGNVVVQEQIIIGNGYQVTGRIDSPLSSAVINVTAHCLQLS